MPLRVPLLRENFPVLLQEIRDEKVHPRLALFCAPQDVLLVSPGLRNPLNFRGRGSPLHFEPLFGPYPISQLLRRSLHGPVHN